MSIPTHFSNASHIFPMCCYLVWQSGLFDFHLVLTIGLNMAFVACFEEQRAARAARWVVILPHA